MEMFILIVMILGLGYAIVLVKDLQTDTTKLKSAVENVMKKFDDIIARLNKVKIPKKEEIKEDQVDRLPIYVKINNNERLI